MRTKQMLPMLLGLVLLSLSTTAVLADPLTSGSAVVVGDRYAVTTLQGYARTWIDGHWTKGPADLEMQVQVTFVGQHNVVFKVLSGSFQIRYKPYLLDVGHWRGDYDRDTHTSMYQGPATAPDGRQAYFVLYGQDKDGTPTGVYMHIVSDFRGEYGAVWHVDLSAFRYAVG